MADVYRIRKARDPRRCLGLDALLFPDDEMDCPQASVWWEVLLGDELVGYAAGVKERGDPKNFVLTRAGVAPEHRGRGLQKRLIRVREAYARSIGCTTVTTYTSTTNLASANNLAHSGYRLYTPDWKWGLNPGLYFIKKLDDKKKD